MERWKTDRTSAAIIMPFNPMLNQAWDELVGGLTDLIKEVLIAIKIISSRCTDLSVACL